MTVLPSADERHRLGRPRARRPATQAARPGPVAALEALFKRLRGSEPDARTWTRALGWEGWLAVFALLHGSRSFDLLFGPAALGIGSVVTGIWLLLYVAILVLFVHRYQFHWLPWLLRHQPLLCAVVGIAVASWFWSIAPEFTWKRAIHLVGTTLIGIYIGYRFAPRTLLAILFYTLVVIIVGSAILALALPEYGQTLRPGGRLVWVGLMENRNHLGYAAAIAVVFFLIATLFGRVPWMIGATLALLSVLALIMTRSATAMVTLPVGLFAAVIFILSKRIRAPSALTLVLLLAAGGGLAFYVATSDYLYDFTDWVGRDHTFTNRTDIWSAAWQATLDRPWLGWGYGTLWSVSEESAFIQEQILRTSWTASHAHNGFLNVASELGLPAALAAIGWVLMVMLKATQLYIRRASPFAVFAIAFLFMFVVENLPEVWMFMHRDFFWLLFVALTVAVSRSADVRHRSDRHEHRSNRLLRMKSRAPYDNSIAYRRGL